MRRAAIALVCASALLVGAGCGDDPDEGATPALDLAVTAVREAAEAGDATEARQHLEAMRREVDRALEAGEIDEERADAILAATEEVEAALGGAGDAPETTTSTTTSTTAPLPPPDEDDKEDKDDEDGGDKGKGKGKDGGRDD